MTELWSHQQAGHDLLKPLTAAGLFMEMGTGKSLVALKLLETWDIKRALIVCPKAVMPVWENEFAKHTTGWRVTVLDAASVPKKLIQAQQALKNPNGRQAIVVNYESLWRDKLGAFFQENPPEAVIADELHRIKSARGIASRYMARLAPKVRRRLGLTGTPLAHSPLDAYAQFRFLDPRIFGFSFTRFRAKYAMMGGFQNHQILKFINLEDLHQKMYSIAYRVRAEDVLDLPEVLEQTITFELSPKAKKIYDSLEKDLIAEIEAEKIISVPNVLAKLLRLSQLTGGWLTPDGAARPERVDFGKAEVLKDLLEDMGTEPVVVFCRFHADLDAVKIVCDFLKLTSCELSGRKNDSERFYQGKAQVFIAQIRSGSLGINLTRARYEIFYSTGYSLGDLEQAKKRVHRPGQDRPVTIYYLAAKGTVDVKIIQALEKRSDLIKFIIDTMRRK